MVRRRWLTLALTGLSLIGGLAITLAAPPVAAAICPACYGLHQIGPRHYSDDPAGTAALDIGNARQQVAEVWGDLRANPVILICTRPECDHNLGGRGARGMTYGAWVIHLSPKGANQTIAAHELAHAELHHRLGLTGWWNDTVPAWLNEGLAVLISRDARYLNRPEDCAGLTVADLPQSARDWSRQAETEHDRLYAQAACAAQDWLASRGGISALPVLFP